MALLNLVRQLCNQHKQTVFFLCLHHFSCRRLFSLSKSCQLRCETNCSSMPWRREVRRTRKFGESESSRQSKRQRPRGRGRHTCQSWSRWPKRRPNRRSDFGSTLATYNNCPLAWARHNRHTFPSLGEERHRRAIPVLQALSKVETRVSFVSAKLALVSIKWLGESSSLAANRTLDLRLCEEAVAQIVVLSKVEVALSALSRIQIKTLNGSVKTDVGMKGVISLAEASLWKSYEFRVRVSFTAKTFVEEIALPQAVSSILEAVALKVTRATVKPLVPKISLAFPLANVDKSQ
mmetsp:Transcript_51535/g.137541  ORF Transcript_51535/g.137541 Transcript_51535/m.137541 type:complete len:292 (+) Transcript_51535:986-1861(+)